MYEYILVFRRIKKSANDTSTIKVQSNEKKRPVRKHDITGIILANQWDENGNVIGVSAYTDQEEVYIEEEPCFIAPVHRNYQCG